MHRSPTLRGKSATVVLVLSVAVATATCMDGDGPLYGLGQRQIVEGIAIPDGLPDPSPLQAVRAFPNLWFQNPLFLCAPPDGSDRVFVLEQRGVVRAFANDPSVTATSTFLDIQHLVNAGGEEGLLGFAFHPDYAVNGQFYTYYSAAGPRRSVLSRWQVSGGDPDAADPASETILMQIAQPYSNHNGGSMAFGPDGKLYVTLGDGGSGNDPQQNGQDLTTLLGSVLRLEPDGTAPTDNPFVGGAAGERAEIWAYGLRNPWRMSFDRLTGQMWLGDVGQARREEINLVTAGGNYGWRTFEGALPNINPNGVAASAFTAPVIDYERSLGGSVTGGYVYRGSRLPSLVGVYLYADFLSGRVWGLVHDGDRLVSNDQLTTVLNPASFGEDQAGEVYVCSFDGNIYRFEETAPGGAVSTMPATLSATGLFADVTRLTPAPGVIEYDVNAPLWSDAARKRRWIALPGTSRITFHATEAWTFPIGTVLVKHFEIETAPGVTRRLETRVLVRQTAGWRGHTYKWNAAGSDADLLSAGETEVLDVTLADNSTRQQTWTYPSSAQCTTCHTAASGEVLGVRTRQLNRDFDYVRRVDNQLRAWNHIGLFTTDIGDHLQFEALTDLDDATASVASRARSYLAANCAMCHLPAGPTPVDVDLRFGIDAANLNAAGILATNPVDGASGALRILAGDRTRSDLWIRMGRHDSFAMPPLARGVTHDAALEAVGLWIDAGAGN